MTLEGLLSNARTLQAGLQDGSLMREVLMRHEQDIIEQQRIQLLEGKTIEGKDIHPSYSEDVKPRGYFRTKDSAARYAAWKQTISYPFSVQRNADTPNLYITGVFHNDLGVDFGADAVSVVPDTAYAAKIMAKYGRGMFGLCTARWKVVFDELGAKDDIINETKRLLWQ